MVALDGLRGLAICSVILFHAGIGFDIRDPFVSRIAAVTGAGWIGVDLFFVLSGFLITGILLDTRDSQNYFRSFYARRVLRIFPLYYATLFVIFVLLPLVVAIDSAELAFLFRNQGWFWTFLSNVGYMVHQDAFGNAEWLWMDHFWSLALEEQFYLLWPLLVWKLSIRRVVQVSLLLICFSLCMRLALAGYGITPGGLYFPTPCRLDGLSAGAIAAVLYRSRLSLQQTRGLKAIWCVSATLVGVIAISRGGIPLGDKVWLTVGLTALAVFFSGIVLWAASTRSGEGFGAWILTHPSLCFFGKYSYGMYVLHHLLLPVILYRTSGPSIKLHGSPIASAIATASITIAVSVAVGILSWHLLEKHFLKLKRHFEY